MPITVKQYQETQAISGLWTPKESGLVVPGLDGRVRSADPTFRNLANFGYGILLGSGLEVSPDFSLEDMPGSIELFEQSGEANSEVLEYLEGLNNEESRLASAGLAIASLAFVISNIKDHNSAKTADALNGMLLTEGLQIDTDKAESSEFASELLGMPPIERINIVHSFLPIIWRSAASPNADEVVSDKTDIYLYARQDEKFRTIANWTLALSVSKGRFDAYFSKTAPNSHVTAGRNNLFFDELHLVTRTLLRIRQ